MKQLKVAKNLTDNRHKKGARRIFKKLVPVLAISMVLTVIALVVSLLSGSKTVTDLVLRHQIGVNSTDGRTQVLLLGNPGGTHEGPYLTDTVMVASINHKEKKAYLISLPRDLWVDKTKSKLNAVYEIGRSKGGSLSFAKQTAGEILGLPIHYGVRLDFRGFIKAVDELGGIEVLVHRSFDDYNYPIEGKENDLCGYEEKELELNEEEARKLNVELGKHKFFIAPDGKVATDAADPVKGSQYFSCRFEHVRFDQGETIMDGETALKYVRSRKGTNDEGSDFARAKRQQKILEAARGKILSFETLTDPDKLSFLIKTYGESIETDIPIIDILEFYKIVKGLAQVESFVVDNSEKSRLPGERLPVLIQPPTQDFGGAYVLIPRGGFDTVHQYVAKILSGEVSKYEATTSARVSDR